MIKNHLSSHQVYITCKHDKMENLLNTVEQIGQWQKYNLMPPSNTYHDKEKCLRTSKLKPLKNNPTFIRYH